MEHWLSLVWGATKLALPCSGFCFYGFSDTCSFTTGDNCSATNLSFGAEISVPTHYNVVHESCIGDRSSAVDVLNLNKLLEVDGKVKKTTIILACVSLFSHGPSWIC